MNLGQLRKQLQQGPNLIPLQQVALRAAVTVLVRIGSDFDQLPRKIVEDFWADAFGAPPGSQKRPEAVHEFEDEADGDD